jgi:hypothetical protein
LIFHAHYQILTYRFTFISPYFSYAELTFREMQEEMLSKLVPAVVMLVLGVLEALGGLSAPNNLIICP